VVVRGNGNLRNSIARLQALNSERQQPTDRGCLGQVAHISLVSQPSVIQRVDQQRTVTLLARHPKLTAQGIADQVAATTARLTANGKVSITLGGEIEENASANNAIAKLLPACVLVMFLLFVWQFDSIRKSLIVMTSIPFVSIGGSAGAHPQRYHAHLCRHADCWHWPALSSTTPCCCWMPSRKRAAKVCLQLQAIEDAAAKRLRPIVMTKMVCILGLLPLWLFGGAVWTSLAVVMMGGLALGTLITLGLIPALYASFYRISQPGQLRIRHVCFITDDYPLRHVAGTGFTNWLRCGSPPSHIPASQQQLATCAARLRGLLVSNAANSS
jgi:multidrug efflux pump subunit AcrB